MELNLYNVSNISLHETDLNKVGKQSTAQFLLQDLSVPDDEITAWHQRWEEDVHQTSITEVWER